MRSTLAHPQRKPGQGNAALAVLNEAHRWVTTWDEWEAEKAERYTRAEEAQRANAKWQESLRSRSALALEETGLYNEVEQASEWVYGMEMDEWWRMGIDWTKGFRSGEAQNPGPKTSDQEVEWLCGLTGADPWVLLQVGPYSTPTVEKKAYCAKLLRVHPDDCAHPNAPQAVQLLRSA